MQRPLVVALASLALACGAKKEKKAEPATGSAAAAPVESGASAPGSAAPAGSGSAIDSACDDADLEKHIQNGLDESVAYLGVLERRVGRWKKDCESAKQDLLGLEANATRFMDAMQAFTAWGEKLTPECRQRVAEIGEQHAMTKDVEARTPAIEERVKPMLERCKDHPGFAEAAAKGLRLMRTKKSAQ